MPRSRNPNRDKAYEIYKKSKGSIALVDLAAQLGVSAGTVRGWKSKDRWDDWINGTLQKKTERSKRKRGGQPGNKNGKGGPEGNLKALKHGAYQSLYSQMLPEEERKIYDQLTAVAGLDEEIKLLRLKLARLLNRDKTFVYDMFGNKYDTEITEEAREKGIIICVDQLRKLIMGKAKIENDAEKLGLLKLKQGIGDDSIEDDGFLEALMGTVKEVWADEPKE